MKLTSKTKIMKNNFIPSLTNYKRFKTSIVYVGNVPVGGHYPIRVQSMTDTDTKDVEKTTEQIIAIIRNGADYVRISVPTLMDVEAAEEIKRKMHEKGVGDKPLVADVHFNAKVAFESLKYFEKIRINPGNFVDKKIRNKKITDELYNAELQKIDEILKEFFKQAKKYGRSIRIGTNYGSLSDRIIYRYGNTVEGLVEATMEYLRIAKKYDFKEIIISIKASNPAVMIYSNRLLIKKMYEEGMDYPIHLGVTEAGNGIEGRIKSAIGIGGLLIDGIGDTIRVSLTEPPENELPACWKIIEHIEKYKNAPKLENIQEEFFSYYHTPKNINKYTPLVITDLFKVENLDRVPDYFYTTEIPQNIENTKLIVPFKIWQNNTKNENIYPLLQADDFIKNKIPQEKFIIFTLNDITKEFISKLKKEKQITLVFKPQTYNVVGETRLAAYKLRKQKIDLPLILHFNKKTSSEEDIAIEIASDSGILLIDGIIDGLFIQSENINPEKLSNIAYTILQSTGRRITKAEYISCPGCARTLFDLQKVTEEVKKATSHLKGIKIAIMGCIVNGPGEMLDADFGYVGASPGKITLYKGQKPVKTIDQKYAIEELVNLIKESGKWTDK